MNSCLYDCTVMHHRLEPRRHRFVYRLFMFYLDLDELDALSRRLKLVSRNRRNVYQFRDTDHLANGHPTTRENIVTFLRSKGIEIGGGKIFLLTHLRTFGHVFNPVSFYYCFREDGTPLCAVAEVGNTFNEQKPFLLGPDRLRDGAFQDRQTKHFYVSPFIDLETAFDFSLGVPDEKLQVRINDYRGEHKFFLSTLSGTRRPLTGAALLRYTLRLPLITLKVIGLIHFHALLLYLKRIPFFRKAEHPELQQEVYSWNR